MGAMKKIIIKIGSSALLQGAQNLSRRHMLRLVEQIAHLHNQGLQIILVSSGAVATGQKLLNSLPQKQAHASIGQLKLIQMWSELFAQFDLHVGQVLLTKDNFYQCNRDHTKCTLDSLIQHQIIPIINENDAAATIKSRIGDNDSLAALVATLIGADTIILLTDLEGFYTADPRFNPDAELISQVHFIDKKTFALAGGTSTSYGTGGMITKIQAAQIAIKSGIQTIIASSDRPNVLIDLVEGKQIGTRFLIENKEVMQ